MPAASQGLGHPADMGSYLMVVDFSLAKMLPAGNWRYGSCNEAFQDIYI
jgi:hypothetical protein